ncbi:MAG: 50S ribosomal protein L3 [Bifidobacteriaceae bacterium]|jgi:large subunit ribosomal protein L3|nr:50S ribosomal protein L3 [Bifidobacteriaceae bacterium]
MTTVSLQVRPKAALLGTKLGMTQAWDRDGRVVPLTVIEVGANVVAQVRTEEVDGYSAVQLAYGQIDPRRVNQPMTGHFKKAGVNPRRYLAEVKLADSESYEPGRVLTVEVFEAGQLVDVTGTTKGKGTAGVMKRHGFAGVGASHGSHRNHRKPGSIGACATPARVLKGMRMAGRMGHARHTTLNLLVHAVDADQGLILVKGAVPGPKGGLVLVRSAVKGEQSR